MTEKAFGEYFSRLAAGRPGSTPLPHPWQAELAACARCTDRLIRIPTGFGKTLGVLAAWLWHGVERGDPGWPRRLVWCLPMRVLVEQTEHEVRTALDRVGRLWDGRGDHRGRVGVHRLMGGVDAGDWHLHPEHPAVLVGTQDMLLSSALNRGYATPRARWPMVFGLLHQDCLWVMDEVQLMDTGFATSGQLQAFRNQDAAAGRQLRPCHSWWMSATLQRDWLAKSPETAGLAATVPGTSVPPAQRKGLLWEGVEKPLRIEAASSTAEVAKRVAQAHHETGRGANGPSLVVVNTVRQAIELRAALARDRSLEGTDLRLVHSRFRPVERAAWREAFLNREACSPGTDRIIVATQVVEAGVDISAGLLVTWLAPWPSLVQRFGRAARWGGRAQVIVLDPFVNDAEQGGGKASKDPDKLQKAREKQALPYDLAALDAARAALQRLGDASPMRLEAFEEANPSLLAALYPYRVRHLLQRHEIDELFDTALDLSGADIDIARFIRSGEDRDLQVFWADIPQGARLPPEGIAPSRDALCGVPCHEAREWLCGKETATSRAPRLREGRRAWVWDYLDAGWRVVERKDLYPGQTVLVAADSGGYRGDTGWDPESREPVRVVPPPVPRPEDRADAGEDDETLSITSAWQTIATHGAQVGHEVAAMAEALGLSEHRLLDLAGRWHDAGKALPPFQASISDKVYRPSRQDLAKAPQEAWLPLRQLYPDPPRGRRRGFRHELASTLALFAVLIRHQPDHPALLGPWRTLLSASGIEPGTMPTAAQPPSTLEREILDLPPEDFDLLAYLVCSHHGKVRMAWQASPADQASGDPVLRLFGVRHGETLPALLLFDAAGRPVELPPSTMRLEAAAIGLNPVTGRSWNERVLGLLHRHGPFALAYREALLRAADQRASRFPVADPLLEEENAGHGLEASHRPLAQAAATGTPPAASARDPAPRGELHGDGGGAGQRAVDPHPTATTRPGTRQLETRLGLLDYRELAPHLAARVALLEADIADRADADRPFDETLLKDFHRRLCADLVPDIAGRWRSTEVQVGAHLPPPAWQVPMAMRNYCEDLATRLRHAAAWDEDRLLELLVFAEGRLLHIHPFADFNGRLTRLLLIELLYRLDLPIVDTATSDEVERQRYFEALRAYDAGDTGPLSAVWRQRFEREASP
jgi:CRISPR-associated endonuclease/helicase Cas3